MTRLHCFPLPSNWVINLLGSPSHEDNTLESSRLYIDHLLGLDNSLYYITGDRKTINFPREDYSHVLIGTDIKTVKYAAAYVEESLTDLILKECPNAIVHKFSTISYSKETVSISLSFSRPSSTKQWLEHYIFGLINVMRENIYFDKDQEVYTIDLFGSKTYFVFSEKNQNNSCFFRKMNSDISLFEQIKYLSILINSNRIMLVNI